MTLVNKHVKQSIKDSLRKKRNPLKNRIQRTRNLRNYIYFISWDKWHMLH